MNILRIAVYFSRELKEYKVNYADSTSHYLFPKIQRRQVIYNFKNNFVAILIITHFSLSHHPGNHVINYLRSLIGSQDPWNLFVSLNKS